MYVCVCESSHGRSEMRTRILTKDVSASGSHLKRDTNGKHINLRRVPFLGYRVANMHI